jgi:hypothetical protein
MIPKADGKGYKRGKAAVRVSGPPHMVDAIVTHAKAIAAMLEAGEYNGPKHVTAKHVEEDRP